MDISDLRGVQTRLAVLSRDEQGAVSFAVVEALRPLARLGGERIAPADLTRLMERAQAAMQPADATALQGLLAEAEAMPVMTASDEPSGSAAFAMHVLVCLIYAIKTVTEPEPGLWSGYCVQRAYDCVFFADETLDRFGSPARLMRAVNAWLDGDGGDLLRLESATIAASAVQLGKLG